MSIERTVNTPSGAPSTVTLEKLDAVKDKLVEELSEEEMEARIARVLDRGYLNDRLTVQIPDNLVGEWVRDDPMEVSRKQEMGFIIDNTFAPKNTVHNDGTRTAKVGDVIFMTTTKKNYSIIERVRTKKFMEIHNPKKLKEDSFLKDKFTHEDLPLIDNSSVQEHVISKNLE